MGLENFIGSRYYRYVAPNGASDLHGQVIAIFSNARQGRSIYRKRREIGKTVTAA